MDIPAILKDYGWLGVLILYFGPKVWQFFTDRFYPSKIAEKKRDQDRKDAEVQAERAARDVSLQAEREARALLLKSQIDREERDFVHRQAIDGRIATAIEGMGTSIQQMGLAITVGNERITQLISAHSRHDNFTVSSSTELTEKMDQLAAMIETQKEVLELRRQLMDTQERIKAISKNRTKGQPE